MVRYYLLRHTIVTLPETEVLYYLLKVDVFCVSVLSFPCPHNEEEEEEDEDEDMDGSCTDHLCLTVTSNSSPVL